MPAIIPFYAANDKKLNQLGDLELKDRRKRLARYWRYYEGNHDRSLHISKTGIDYNVIINVAAQAIDKMVSFFIPKPPRIIILPVDSKPLDNTVSPQQEKINEFWMFNTIESSLLDIALSGFISGHVFLRLVHTGDVPTLGLIDPANITVYWDTTNIDKVVFYRLSWDVDPLDSHNKKKHIQDIVPVWLIDKTMAESSFEQAAIQEDLSLGWLILEYIRDGDRLTLIGMDRWEFEFPPIIDWKNAQNPLFYYGQSDLKHVDLNDAINFIASNMNKIIYHHAGPQTVLTGGNLPDDVVAGPDTIIKVPDKDAKLFNLEMQSELEASMSLMDILRSSFFAQIRVVDLATIKDKLARVTNFGVRMIHSDMLDMIMNKHVFYGRGINETTRRALIIMGEDENTLEKITTQFTDPLPTDSLEIIQAMEIEQRTGILSRSTTAEQMGRNPKTEISKLEEEQNIDVLNQEPETPSNNVSRFNSNDDSSS